MTTPSTGTPAGLDVAGLRHLLDSGHPPRLIDVRTPTEFTAAAVGSVVGLGVLCTAAAFMVFFALIAEVGPARATVITYVNPAVAIILGALVLSEPLTTGMMIGFPLVILGSYLGTTRSPPAAPNAVSQPSS